ncbi:hypothetical protein NQ315_010957 [Exocentrus adspersus]|uniref:Integrase p58-like C-terminal domain-containing protein n=1 Tax=Exocentrus adspersus TaxID=1586481 RepID=A0AAV8VGP5_9CUCU|nr:hypothetical protein NQ315_010957 [Exocentrus adspersus]
MDRKSGALIHWPESNKKIQMLATLYTYRSAVHESTGKTPASVVFGAELRLPIDLISDRPKKEEGVNNYISHLQDRLKLTHAEVRQKMRIESDRMKTRYDLRANTGGFQVGEKVWLYNPKRTKGKSPKLQKSWEGPYIVVTRLNDVVYRIQKNPQAKMKIVHIDRLTPYQEPHPNEGNSLDFYKLLDSSKLVYKPGKFGREEVFKLFTVDTATSLRFVTFVKDFGLEKSPTLQYIHITNPDRMPASPRGIRICYNTYLYYFYDATPLSRVEMDGVCRQKYYTVVLLMMSGKQCATALNN